MYLIDCDCIFIKEKSRVFCLGTSVSVCGNNLLCNKDIEGMKYSRDIESLQDDHSIVLIQIHQVNRKMNKKNV